LYASSCKASATLSFALRARLFLSISLSLGTIIFLIGFIIAAYLAYAKFFMAEYKMTERPLFYFGLLSMIIGTQLFVSGFVAELISRTSQERNKYLIEKEIGFDK